MPTTEELNLERAIRARLDGVDLVCEADPTDAELAAAEATCRAAFERRAVDELRLRMPATFAIYVVMRGSERYRGNALWPQLGVRAEESSRVGQAFLAALRRLGLPDFQRMVEREGARRYVAPVLIHGGIPACSAMPLVERVERELRRGLVDGNEAVQRLTLDASLVSELGRPTARLVKHVPVFAIDLIDTLIDRITGTPRRPGQHALPRHIQEALDRSDAAEHRGLRRVKPPRVEIDVWSSLGPELVAPDRSRQVAWCLDGGGGPIAVHPGQRTLLPPVDRLTITGEGRVRPLWNHPVLWFDISGRLLNDSTNIPTQAFVILPPEWRINPTGGGAALIEEEGLPLSGAWSRHRLLCVEAPGDTVIRLAGPNGLRSVSMRVIAAMQQPRLQGEPIAGLRACDGRPVFGRAPSIQTRCARETIPVWWTIDGESTRCTQLTVDAIIGTVDLDPVLPVDRIHGLTVELRGTDDRRTSLTCVVAPSTTVEVATTPLGPQDRCEVNVIGPSGEVMHILGPPLAEAVELDAPWVPAGLLEVPLPRVRWALRSERPDRLDLAPGTIEVEVDDLLEETPVLVVRAPDGVDIGVFLLVDGLRTQATPPQRARGVSPDRAQVVIPLSRMADTIRVHRARDLRLMLEVSGKQIEAIRTGTGRTSQPRRSWGRALEPANPTRRTVWESMSWWSRVQAKVDGNAAELAENLAGLDPGDQIVQFVSKLGGSTGDWARDLRRVDPGRGPGGVEWSIYEAAADVLWQVQGVRYRDFAGGLLEESCLRWARRCHQNLRRADPNRRAAAELWCLGRMPTDQQLRDWPLGHIVSAARLRTQGKETGIDQLPRALLFQLLLVAAGNPIAGGAVAGAVEIDPEGVLGGVALLLEAARRGQRLDLAPPATHFDEAPEVLSPQVATERPAPAMRPLTSLDSCRLRVNGSTLVITPPEGQSIAPPAIRLVDPESAEPLAVLSTVDRDGSFLADVPPELHGRVGIAVVDRSEVPGRYEFGGWPSVDLGPMRPRPTSRTRSCRLGNLKQSVADQLVDDLVLSAGAGRLEFGLVEQLFDDEHAAGAALVRCAERHPLGALDRVGIAILPTATLFSTIVGYTTSLQAICRGAPILGAALLPEAPAAWRAIGWSNPHRFHAGAHQYEDVVHLARRLAPEPTSCALRTYRYRPSDSLDSGRAQWTLRHLDNIGIPRSIVDLAIVTRQALTVDALSGEASRTLLAAYADNPAMTTAGVLVGTALTYADNAAPESR